MNESRSAHERHDPLLIAAHAAGDTGAADADRASGLIRDCPLCADLHADLTAIAAAVHELPPVSRSRDFRLSPGDAARLDRSGWRRWVGAFATDRWRLARPVGAAFASLGVAGLLFASLPGVPLGGAAAAPAAAPAVAAPAAAPGYEAAPSAASGAMTGGEQAEDRVTATEQQVDPLTVAAPGEEEAARDRDVAGDAGDSSEAPVNRAVDATLVVLSGSFLILGLGLFGLRWTADRLGDG